MQPRAAKQMPLLKILIGRAEHGLGFYTNLSSFPVFPIPFVRTILDKRYQNKPTSTRPNIYTELCFLGILWESENDETLFLFLLLLKNIQDYKRNTWVNEN